MGQKVNPVGIRLGIARDWNAAWYADSRLYPVYLNQDLKIRSFLRKKYAAASVSNIKIERLAKSIKVTVSAGRPGIILGKKGSDIEGLRKELGAICGVPVYVNVEEIKKVDIDAVLVAQSIAQQLEHRVMFRRAMKRAMQSALKGGAHGIKVCVSGRLGGAEIARTEWYHEGRVPLHTFRAMVDYHHAQARTTYGVIGVKVWIFKGERKDSKNRERMRLKKTQN